MEQLEVRGENAEQIEYWNGQAGDNWTQRNDEMDAMLRPLGATAIERAAPGRAEHILDIGCGCGGTSLDLVSSVGSSGHVLGVDISAPMLALANRKVQALPEGLRDVPAFELADASNTEFSQGSFDLLFSRFGVMFFADPVAAFANMRKALKSGGRLTFLCWGPPNENDWIMTPLMAAREHLPPTEPMDPRAPGPFAFSNQAYVTDILASAGFSNISFEATSPVMKMGRGQSLEETAEFFMELGPVSRALVDQDDALRTRVKGAIIEAIADRYKNGYVEMGGRCWIVTAENGPV